MSMHVRQHSPRYVRHSIVSGITIPRALALIPALVIAASAAAQLPDPPLLRCATVDVTGDVIVTWTPTTDPGGVFQRYDIHASNDINGPYVVVGNVPVLGQTNFFHAGAGANAGPRFYYVTTVTSLPPPNFSTPSDTVATLFLQVFQSVPPGSANLAWNAPQVASTATPWYTVWMEYPIGQWNLLATVDTSVYAYQHVIDICADSLTFRVGLADGSGCVSFSNRAGDHFEDVTPPDVPQMVAVSVDSISGLATLEWVPSPQPDTQGYIIVLSTPGGGIIIDTVYGQPSNTYTWAFSTAGLAPESFTLAAFDSCQVGMPPSPNTSATGPPHTTMHAVTVYDQCAGTMRLNWTPYGGWPPQSQEVHHQVDGGAWSLLTNLPGDVSTFQHNVDPDRQYCYVVKAVQTAGGASSLSNRTCRTTFYPGLPAFNYLRTVTVIDADRILVVDSIDAGASVSGYRFERSDNGGPYEEVVFYPTAAGPLINFIDEEVEPDKVGYRYRVVVLDSCGHDAIVSNIGGNILLRAEALLSAENVLDWNGYANWAGFPAAYRIHRSIEDLAFTQLATLPPQPWTWTDNVANLIAGDGRACYYVEALEAGNPSGINATSVSNIVCAVQEDLVFIPNAFVVGGVNTIFQPVLGFVDVSDYTLNIINRWGQVVWTTNDPLEGWDGQVDGRLVPIGVYGYFCGFSNGAGRRFEKRGTVTMLTALE